MATSETSVGICWLRNDLRLDDNPVLLTALAEHDRVVVFYGFDLRLFAPLTNLDFRKTGVHRAAFLLESVADLRARIRELGGAYSGAGLVVRTSEDVPITLAELARQVRATAVYVQAEVHSEETDDEAAAEAALGPACPLHRLPGKTLYHPDDLPFDPDAIPEPFKSFRKPIEYAVTIRPAQPAPERIPGLPDLDPGELPTLTDLGFSEDEAAEAQPAYPGGETAALARLAYYLDDTHLVKTYRSTRNLSLGPDYSTKFSPYLAVGCLSPRRIHAEIRRYQQESGTKAGNNILFEMRWRDYFIFLGRKHGNRLFRPGGFRNRKEQVVWNEDAELFATWTEGRTGIPFIDAHMRELEQTGWMSNRGRVNCASFLTRDYRIDWRWGAAWFENRLIDYEVSANWFNWHTQALDIYYTSAPWQGLKYDKQGEYVKAWLPELESLPAPLVHAPWKMEAEEMLTNIEFDLERDYARPRVQNSKWDWAWERIKKGDASSPRRRRKA